MTAAVNVNKTDFAAKARTAWGQPPEWVARLAAEASRTGLKATAKRIGRSDALVSQVLGAKYGGDLGKVETAVRGALMGETVTCPVLGEIGRDQCLREQAMPRSATSAIRSRLWHECRGGCEHSRLAPSPGGSDAT